MSTQDMASPGDDFRRTVAGIWFFTIGVLSYVLLPGVVGAVAELPGFDDRAAGLIGAAQTFGSAFGLLIPSLAMTRLRVRRAATFAVVVLVVANALSMLVLTPLPLAIVRFAAGAAEGALLGMGIGLLSSMQQSDVRYAIALVAQFVSGALVLYNLPAILGVAGFRSLAAVFLVLPAFAPLILRWVPARVDTGVASPRHRGEPLISRQVVLPLLAFGLLYTANGGSWAYAERIGAAAGLSLEVIGAGLSLSMLGGIAGSGLAALCARVVPRIWSLLFAGFLGVISVLILTLALDASRFTLAVFLMNFVVGFAAPFYLAVLADRDPSGRVGSFAYVLNLGASGVGPAIAALLVGSGYNTMLYAAAGIYVLGYLVALPVLMRGREGTD